MIDQYVYGIQAIQALLLNQRRSVNLLYVTQDRLDKRIQDLLELSRQREIVVERLSSKTMNQRFPHVVHQGVVAKVGLLPEYSERDLPRLLELSQNPCLILILDGVTDPHNLGACLRSADGAGVDFVIIPKDKNATVTSVVSKVACGAAESIPLVRVTNLARAIDTLKQRGVWVYGAAHEAETLIYHLDYQCPVAMILGGEGQGIRRLTRKRCDALFALPMLGSVSSLNVSVATGICLYEAVRQRKP